MSSAASIALVKDAVAPRSVLSASGVLERVFTAMFGGFVYNQIWEDPRADREGLRLQSNSRLLTISSAGCNVLSYLVDSPQALVALDVNRSHIYLTRLKLAALAGLPSYEEFFRFFGCADASGNVNLYRAHVRAHLDRETRAFWEDRPFRFLGYKMPRIYYFERNLYRYGVLGYFLRFLHGAARVLGHKVHRLLDCSTLEQQARVFEEVLGPIFRNRVLRAIGRMPVFLFGLGIPPRQRQALMQECEGDIIGLYRERVRRLACSFPMQENYFAWQAFGRCYDRRDRRAVPEYLREDHYETLKGNIGRVKTHVMSLTDYLAMQPAESLDRFVFLDAQDWMSPDQIVRLWREVARVGCPGSRILFRTAASRSPIDELLPSGLRRRFAYDEELSQRLHALDRAAIYGGLHVYVLEHPTPGPGRPKVVA
jgi:S-adenosylmethionine-diacylglycerol 3-amino-3-carboxypropyl transferase